MRAQSLVLALAFLCGNIGDACDTGFRAFEQTVFAKVRKDCAKCHDGQRPNAPAFAIGDMAKSYELVANYMNFTKTDESLLVIRAGNGHCGTDKCEEESGREMAELAERWWSEGEKTCERNGKFFTAEQDIPADLPGPKDGFRTLRFPLRTINPRFQDVYLQIDAQEYLPASKETRGAYRFKSPRLVGGKNPLHVQDLKILLNGKHDLIYNAYTTIDQTYSFSQIEDNDPKLRSVTGVLSGQGLIIMKDSLPNPKLSVSFVAIEEKAQGDACKNPEKFAQNVTPLFARMQCATCHNGKNASIGERVFNVNLDNAALCTLATQLVDPRYPMVSPLLTLPARGFMGHPKLEDGNRIDYVGTVKAWLDN